MTTVPDEIGILYVDQSPAHGGSIESLSRLLKGLDGNRYRGVVVLARRETRRPLFNGVRVEIVDRRPSLLNRRPSWKRLVGLRRGIWRVMGRLISACAWVHDVIVVELPRAVQLYRLGKRYRCRLVHLNNLSNDLAGVAAAKLLGVPCVNHHRDFEWKSPATRWCAKMADHHIAISETVKNDLISLGVNESSISVVHDSVDLSRFDGTTDIDELKRRYAKRPDERFFGIFGRIVRWKGHEVFLHAAARVLTKYPSTRAFVVGDTADGPSEYLDELKALAAETGISSSVVFTGFDEDIAPMMKLMDIVVHASIRAEPFGMVIIEAMASGRAVVATEGGGPTDIIIDGKTGILVPRGDSVSLAEAIGELLEDEVLCRRLGDQGRRAVEDRFLHTRHAEEISRIYETLLASEGRPRTRAGLSRYVVGSHGTLGQGR